MKDRQSCADFDFDLAQAVLDQLVTAFDQLETGRLAPDVCAKMKLGQGVYKLFLDDQLKYIGKAKSLPRRLERHYRVLSGRQNIEIERLGFKGLYIHRNWSTLTTEAALIRHFRESSPWNTSGMGSNDPGHNREDSAEDDTFNSLYPINPDFVCDWIQPGEYTAWKLLADLKKGLPYLLRYHRVTRRFRSQADRDAEEELKKTKVIVLDANVSARNLLLEIASQLPDGWQATQFSGRLILYKEQTKYRHGHTFWPAS